MNRQEIAIMMAKNTVENNRNRLKHDMTWLMRNIIDLNNRMTDDNLEHIASELVSQLTGSLVRDIISGEARLKEAQQITLFIEGMVDIPCDEE